MTKGGDLLVWRRARTKSRPRFVADAMLGSLARKLRIFGFDTLYFAEGEDAELEGLARGQRRVILTADRELVTRSTNNGIRALLVEGRTDETRLLSVTRQLQLESLRVAGAGNPSRCAECNGELQRLSKAEASREDIPPKVLARHRLFYRCVSCSRLYWRGGHWKRLRRLSYSLRTKALT